MIDVQNLYAIRWRIARDKKVKTYGELSDLYQARVGWRPEPHGTWDMPLDEINKRLDAAGYPPLSAVIINQATILPGGGFWGCCSRTQVPLKNDDERRVEHAAILEEVYGAAWPHILP